MERFFYELLSEFWFLSVVYLIQGFSVYTTKSLNSSTSVNCVISLLCLVL